MNLKQLRKLSLIPILVIVSCTPYKNVPYFQDVTETSSENITNYNFPTIQPGDFIGIHMSSSNPQADAVFNSNMDYKLDNPTDPEHPENIIHGYQVDREGFINLPTLGMTKVVDFYTDGLAKHLQNLLKDYFLTPVITVRILNFKISVLGDVKSPGVFRPQDNKINVNEALALAGDISITGLRENVLLIRENKGLREYIKLDLRSKAMMSSYYYYLKNDDILYVTPGKQSTRSTSNTYEVVGLGISVLSIITFLITRR